MKEIFTDLWRHSPKPLKIMAVYVAASMFVMIVRDAIMVQFGFLDVLGFYLLEQMLFVALSGTIVFSVARHYSSATRKVLEESAATAQALFESAAQGVVIADQRGAIVSANPQLVQIFGYDRAELVGRKIEMLMPERLRGDHVAHRREYLKSPRPRPMGLGLDLIGRRKDGTEFPVEVGLSSFESAQGRLAIAFINDISERLKLEHETRKSETLVTLGTISAGIAHELNNPIGIISSRIELMLSDQSLKLPAEAEEDLRVLHRNALRVGTIAKGLLSLARHRPTQRNRVDLNHEIEEVLLLVSKQMAKEGIQISASLEPRLAPIIGDSVALQEVLLNLVMNAREVMQSGGTIRIETAPVSERPGWIQLTVKDSGGGIPAEAIPKLFDPFYTNKANGTGLGLWISKRIIRDHRGTIDVQSQPGVGTSFIINFPCATDEANLGADVEPSASEITASNDR